MRTIVKAYRDENTVIPNFVSSPGGQMIGPSNAEDAARTAVMAESNKIVASVALRSVHAGMN